MRKKVQMVSQNPITEISKSSDRKIGEQLESTFDNTELKRLTRVN